MGSSCLGLFCASFVLSFEISTRHIIGSASQMWVGDWEGEAASIPPKFLLRGTIVNRTYGIHENLYI